MREKLVVGNWKMHASLAANGELLRAIVSGVGQLPTGVCLAVCPPFPYLPQAVDCLAATPVAVGAQDVSANDKGAFTGEVSAQMLHDLGCRYVIVGHSERRTLHRESDDLVAAKAQAALGAGVVPIVCVGETLDEREGGVMAQVIHRQIDAVLSKLGNDFARVVVAYEPVWAIGTGRTASPEQAQEVHALIRARIAAAATSNQAVQILYGGSVKPQNARELFAMPDVDGGLIGGASLVAADFLAIAAAAV